MGHSTSDSGPETSSVRLIASADAWIEGRAIEQLKTTARLDDVRLAVGYPDLHPGKGHPVGAAFVTRQRIYPTLAGNDIGCAMSFWATDVSAKKMKLDRWAQRIHGLDQPWDGELADWRARYGLPETPHDRALGTIGGGNHFAEIQVFGTVSEPAILTALGLDRDRDRIMLLIHSGSRGLGDAILREHLASRGGNGMDVGTPEADAYLARHDAALAFAAANRSLIAHRLASQIGAEARLVSDVPHNLITRETWLGAPAFIHRKGAATARAEALVIPGSRGTPSYLVRPTGDLESAAWSLAHGAGRRWQRGFAKSRLSHKYRTEDLERTELGGRVICEDRELLYDEAPQAYKNITSVIRDLEAAGLITVVAELLPKLTYKVRRAGDDHD